MMTNSSISVFDSRGGLLPRDSINRDGLSAERLERLDALYSAAEAEAAAQAELTAAEKAQSAAVRAESDARVALERVFPRKSFHSLWLDEFAAKQAERVRAAEAGEE